MGRHPTVGQEGRNMERKVLIVDDDRKLLDLLADYLPRFGFQTLLVTEGDRALDVLRQSEPDLVILDVMLPVMNGFEICKAIRQETQIPIIMLTARGEVADRIVGLELGADDYLPKPFEPRELVGRMEAVWRRSQGATSHSRWVFGDLMIDPHAQTVMLKDKELELSTAEYRVLELLARSPGKTFERQAIIDCLHGTDWATVLRSVDVLISRLRTRLLDDPKEPRYIRTVWGRGYRFIGKRGS